MSAYYNELDPKAAATLRELILEGLIAPGDVDERSIEDVLPSEIAGYTQVHLFAGFGIWSLAFRMAGWPDTRPVWSASCPCQPFSAAGKGGGFDDERHLWPSVFWLLQHGKPTGVPVYGEQVASPDALLWLDLVRADLETIHHSCWSTVLASAGFGAPIIRQRSYWMARSNGELHDGSGKFWERRRSANSDRRDARGLGSSFQSRLEGYARDGDGATGRHASLGSVAPSGEPYGMASTDGRITSYSLIQRGGEYGFITDDVRVMRPLRDPGPTNGFWSDVDWLRCRDDKWRPVEPGTFPLAHGYPERVGILRGAGNAISPQVAAAWIGATQ